MYDAESVIKRDYHVHVGDAVCDVVDVSNSVLLCAPPDTQPQGSGETEHPQVKVRWGSGTVFYKRGLFTFYRL